MFLPKKAKLALALSVALFASAPVLAQQTTASVGGRVTMETGTPVSGAEVTILHAPSGTVSRATTDASGRYSARGLRVGGPYTITIEKDGQIEIQENVFLVLNETVSVDALLRDATQLETVQVVGVAAGELFSPDKFGAGTSVSNEQIQAFPSIGRNIQDYVRLDPRISQTDKQRGEISVGGQNTRFNRINIDGVSTNDPFGLESNNLPTLRQPVSIDAIEAISVDVANYDVTITGATGGVINAVTKSGTNEFTGSVYGVYRDNDWVRDNPNGDPFNGFNDEQTYGFTLGGPIIKDTLFFFLNYERFKRSAPGPAFGPSGSGAATEVNISQAQIDEITSIARNVWGMEVGSLAGSDELETDVEEYAAKIDWNINDSHRASYRYSKTEQVEAILPGFSRTNLSLSSYWYNQNKTFESHVVQLFSDWNSVFSTEIKASYRDYSAIAQPLSRLPQVRVQVGGSALFLGTEQFRHANILETTEQNLFAAGNLYLGDHQIKFGFDWTENDIFNLFGRDINGVYNFASIADFAAGTPSGSGTVYSYREAANGELNSIAADWTLKNRGLFIQDNWFLTDNLTVLYGVRVDTPIVDDKPPFNQRIFDLYGLDNTETIDGNTLVQPRFGFNYSFNTERPTQLRGGFGLFQGSAANVWLSNPFSNNGLTIAAYEANAAGAPPFNPDPDSQPTVGNAPRAAVDLVDGNLEQPSAWKVNLAFDHELPWWGMVASAEAIWTRTQTGLYYERLDLGAATRIGPDGRTMFYNNNGYDPTRWGYNASGSFVGSSVTPRFNRPSDIGDVTYARATGKGEGEQYTLSLTKPMAAEDNWFWQVAYTYTDATEVNPLTSSQATSNWNNNAIFQANEEMARRSNYVVRDRFSAALSYKTYLFGENKTEFSMFYEGRRGKPYSWTFLNDANGDSRVNDLFYVPFGPGDVVFAGGPEEEAAFFAYMNQTPELARFAGQVAPRNSEFNPWVNTVDLRISQELPGFFRGNKAEIWLDILNVGNLINKDWGRTEEIGFPSMRGVAYYAGIDPATGKYVYRFTTPDGGNRVDQTQLRDGAGESRWAAQIGFRYRF